MQQTAKKFLVIIICVNFLSPAIVAAAAQVPITQEEIEAILERDQVESVSSTTLPDDLKKRLGQTVASTTDAIKPAITETIDKAQQAIATATKQISSTSDKVKNNLENYKTEAASDLKETFLGEIADFLSSIWHAITGWFTGMFRGKPLVGAMR